MFGGTTRENSDSDPWNDIISDSEDSGQPAGSTKRRPVVVTPIQLLSSGLRAFFKRPGMVSAVNSWKNRPPADNSELKSIQDGNVWKTLKAPDGTSFFSGPGSEDEIRLGVSFGFDW
jgi:hypothetical protein